MVFGGHKQTSDAHHVVNVVETRGRCVEHGAYPKGRNKVLCSKSPNWPLQCDLHRSLADGGVCGYETYFIESFCPSQSQHRHRLTGGRDACFIAREKSC